MNAYVYALVNQKGGIGKTTAAIHLGVGLKRKGFKTLIIDMDAQCNLTFSLGGDYQHRPTIMDAILGKVDIVDTIQHLDEVDVIPGSSNLSTLESKIDPDGREFFLADAIEPLKEMYDFIVIDSPPALSLITVGIMCAADSIIVPVGMDMYSFQGTGQLHRTYNAVKQYCNETLVIEGIFVTQNTVSLTKTLNQIAKKMDTQVFNTTISNSVIIKHAVINQQSLFKYAPTSKPAKEFSNFVDEVLEKRKDRWKGTSASEPWFLEALEQAAAKDYEISPSKSLEDELNEIGIILQEPKGETIPRKKSTKDVMDSSLRKEH